MTALAQTGTQDLRGNSRGSRYDVVVVGAGTAGLSAALMLGRSRRRVLVLDGGPPRNAPASGVHYFFTRDGTPPAELLRRGRSQLGSYTSVELRATKATGATGADGNFEVALEDGSHVETRKLLLASGVHDDLPERPGFQEFWGRGVYHCPYCHGWEVRDRPLAVLATSEETVMRATLIRNWSRDLAVLTDGAIDLDEATRARFDALGVSVKEAKIARLEGDGAAEGLSRIVFEDGSEIACEALFYAPPQRQRSPLAETLGCELVELGGVRTIIKGDPTTNETTVPGVFVAGDAVNLMQGAIVAAASGATTAAFVNHALVTDDIDAQLAGASTQVPQIGD